MDYEARTEDGNGNRVWTESDIDDVKSDLRLTLAALATFFVTATGIVDDMDGHQIIYAVEVGHVALLKAIWAMVTSGALGAGDAYGDTHLQAAEDLSARRSELDR